MTHYNVSRSLSEQAAGTRFSADIVSKRCHQSKEKNK
jgi:hypothetical protein